MDFSNLATAHIRHAVAYDPGHDVPGLRAQFANQGGLLELGSNENCYGPSERVAPKIAAEMDSLLRYPDPLGLQLKKAIAELHNLDTKHVLLGNGSHELLMQIAQVFTQVGDEVLVSRYCFAVYPIAAKVSGARLVVAEANALNKDFPLGHDLNNMLDKITDKTKLICLANPNNPTGTWLTISQLVPFLSAVPSRVLVLIDEAYIEYSTIDELQSCVPLMQRFPNLLITRTFSKAYALAGLRVGYLMANPMVIELIERVRESFNVNSLALVAAQTALQDIEHIEFVREQNAQQRLLLQGELEALGLRVIPSQTNFLLVHFGENTTRLERSLFERGVMLRPMHGYGLGDYLRITVSNESENARLLVELKAGLACP